MYLCSQTLPHQMEKRQDHRGQHQAGAELCEKQTDQNRACPDRLCNNDDEKAIIRSTLDTHHDRRRGTDAGRVYS